MYLKQASSCFSIDDLHEVHMLRREYLYGGVCGVWFNSYAGDGMILCVYNHLFLIR